MTINKVGCIASDTDADSTLGTTAASPIIICEYEGLKDIATEGLDKHYKLGRSIDASDSWSEGDEDCNAYDGTDIAGTSPCAGMTQLGTLTGVWTVLSMPLKSCI